MAYSSNENIATATYIGSSEQSDSAPSYDIEVERLATSQVNMGKFLPANESVGLEPDTYSFDVRRHAYRKTSGANTTPRIICSCTLWDPMLRAL